MTQQIRFSGNENSREKLPDISSYSKSGQERYESDIKSVSKRKCNREFIKKASIRCGAKEK